MDSEAKKRGCLKKMGIGKDKKDGVKVTKISNESNRRKSSGGLFNCIQRNPKAKRGNSYNNPLEIDQVVVGLEMKEGDL